MNDTVLGEKVDLNTPENTAAWCKLVEAMKDTKIKPSHIGTAVESFKLGLNYASDNKEKKYTTTEIKKYLESKDSLGDIHYYLSEENIDKANNCEVEEDS